MNHKIKTRIMKRSINRGLSKLLFLPLIILMTFTSCQDEVIDITDPNERETLVANSTLANLMQNTSLRDGSFDNIIDNANCISINLPVTIIVNGIEITIDSEEDLAVIEAIFDQFSDDTDEIEIVFPITIILNDYTEVTINNLEELEQFIEECTGENEDDDDIECIDFQYPISISVFNAAFEVIETVTINSDEELYDFIEELDGGLLAGINFPVTMVKADGTTIVVNNNDELQAAIEAAEDACDEDDDNDYDDDDNNDIPVDDLNILCSNCTWTVDKLEIGDQNLEDQYEGYVFTFIPDGPVKVEDPNGTIYEGTWGLTENDNGIPALSINIPDLPDFNNELWLLHEIQDENGEIKVDFRSGIDRLRFEQLECDDNNPAVCPEEVVDSYLAECFWRAGFNGDNNFAEYEFYFNANQELVVQHSINDQEIVGTWMTSTNDGGATVITIELGEPLGDFNGEWTVIECDEGRVKIVMNDLYIVFERECEQDQCTQEQVDSYLVECVWNAVNYNGINDFNDWNLEFAADGTFTITNVNGTITAQWASSTTDDGVMIEFSGIDGTSDLQDMNGSWLVIECAEGRLKIVRGDQFIIIERNCETNTTCSETDVDSYLAECIWNVVSYNGSNDLIAFDMDFNTDGTLTITENGQTIDAMWSTSQTNDGVVVEFSNVAGANIQAISGAWLVTECAEDRLKMFNDPQDYIVIERNCN